MEDIQDEDNQDSNHAFVIHPGHGKAAWEIRCDTLQAKKMWLEKLDKSINILTYRTNFEVGRVLGKGASGTVAEMKDKRNGLSFALKTMMMENARDRKQAVAEAQLMQKITNELNHPNLVCCLFFATKHGCFFSSVIIRSSFLDSFINRILNHPRSRFFTSRRKGTSSTSSWNSAEGAVLP